MHKYVKISFLLAALLLTQYYRNRNSKHSINREVGMKYILQWTHSYTTPFIYMGKGQKVFLLNKCPVNNCYIASSTGNYAITDFDAILFHGPELNSFGVPRERSPRQIYIFVSMESSHYYPVLDEKYDNFFNWTWTYKLNSDLYYGYVIIRNKQGEIIGPKDNIHWLKAERMMPINDTLKTELNQKNSAVAWLVSNCRTYSRREKYAIRLRTELIKYNMTLHTYGKCGRHCNNSLSKPVCMNMMKKYYFYLSFENSLSEDYVTEKLLNSLLNDAVPVVYGKANYTRFLPDGAYLDANKIEVKDIAKIIADAVENKTKYYDFFRWRNYYSYHTVEGNSETDYYCGLCSKLNQNQNKVKTYKNFRQWWNT